MALSSTRPMVCEYRALHRLPSCSSDLPSSVLLPAATVTAPSPLTLKPAVASSSARHTETGTASAGWMTHSSAPRTTVPLVDENTNGRDRERSAIRRYKWKYLALLCLTHGKHGHLLPRRCAVAVSPAHKGTDAELFVRGIRTNTSSDEKRGWGTFLN